MTGDLSRSLARLETTLADGGDLGPVAAAIAACIGDEGLGTFAWLDGAAPPAWIRELPDDPGVAEVVSDLLVRLPPGAPEGVSRDLRRIAVALLAPVDPALAAEVVQGLRPRWTPEPDRATTEDALARVALLLRTGRHDLLDNLPIPQVEVRFDAPDPDPEEVAIGIEALVRARADSAALTIRHGIERVARRSPGTFAARYLRLLATSVGIDGIGGDAVDDVVTAAVHGETLLDEVGRAHGPSSWAARRVGDVVVDLHVRAGDADAAIGVLERMRDAGGPVTPHMALARALAHVTALRETGRAADAAAVGERCLAELGSTTAVSPADLAALARSVTEASEAAASALADAPDRRFRLFVSSTFTDFAAERDLLHSVVFPDVRRHCERIGGTFDPVDLRWGIDEAAAEDQRTMGICLEELARSKAVTPRPNVLVLLGQRGGWRPLPELLEPAVFEALAGAASSADRSLLETWYVADANDLVGARRLESASSAGGRWAEVEGRLRAAIDAAAEIAAVPPHVRRRLLATATELEVLEGVLASPDQAVVVARTIVGVPTTGAEDHVDADPAVVARLRALSDDVRAVVPEERWIDISVPWDAEQGRPSASPDVLADLARRIAAALTTAIDEEVAATSDRRREVGWEAAAAAHLAHARERGRLVVGREDAIDDVLLGSDRRPVLLLGEGGIGKSAVAAVVADRAEAEGDVVLRRFVGASPDASRQRVLLGGVAQELAARLGAELPPHPEPPEVSVVRALLHASAVATGVTVVIDGLDQLDGLTTSWIPGDLPPGVRLVLTARPGPELDGVPARRVDLPGLTDDACAAVLDATLAARGRRLQPAQRGYLLDRVRAVGGNALYLRIAIEVVARWPAGDGAPPRLLADDLAGLVEDDLRAELTERQHHDGLLVDRALGYLAASGSGLTEHELVDVLGSDRDLYERFLVGAHHAPPDLVAAVAARDGIDLDVALDRVRADLAEIRRTGRLPEALADLLEGSPGGEAPRLPRLLWSRLAVDLAPFLARRGGDGVELVALLHREMADLGLRRAGGDQPRLHRHLAARFRRSADATGDGTWRAPDHHRRLRGLDALPQQLIRAGAWDEAVAVLSDVAYLEARVRSVPDGVDRLVADLDDAIAAAPP